MTNPFLIISITLFVGIIFLCYQYLKLWKYYAEDQARLALEQRKNAELERSIKNYDSFLRNNCSISEQGLKQLKIKHSLN